MSATQADSSRSQLTCVLLLLAIAAPVTITVQRPATAGVPNALGGIDVRGRDPHGDAIRAQCVHDDMELVDACAGVHDGAAHSGGAVGLRLGGGEAVGAEVDVCCVAQGVPLHVSQLARRPVEVQRVGTWVQARIK